MDVQEQAINRIKEESITKEDIAKLDPDNLNQETMLTSLRLALKGITDPFEHDLAYYRWWADNVVPIPADIVMFDRMWGDSNPAHYRDLLKKEGYVIVIDDGFGRFIWGKGRKGSHRCWLVTERPEPEPEPEEPQAEEPQEELSEEMRIEEADAVYHNMVLEDREEMLSDFAGYLKEKRAREANDNGTGD